MARKIRVVILTRHPGIISGYRYRLSRPSDIEVVGSALCDEELKRLLAYQPADVLLLDMGLPICPDKPNPNRILHVIGDLRKHYGFLIILVISIYSEHAPVNEVMKVGAKGYIFRDDRETIEDLAGVIRQVAKGKVYLSKKASQQLQKQSVSEGEPTLTKGQKQALSLCAAYPKLKGAELAEQLNIKPSSLRNLLSEAYRRLGVRNRKAAIVKARELGLIASNLPSIEIKAQTGITFAHHSRPVDRHLY